MIIISFRGESKHISLIGRVKPVESEFFSLSFGFVRFLKVFGVVTIYGSHINNWNLWITQNKIKMNAVFTVLWISTL